MPNNHPIIFYDGVCGLCNSAVQFVLKHDANKQFRYAALQSETAKNILGNNIQFDSFVLVDNQQTFTRSTAALKVLKQLGGIWSICYVFIIIPPFIRNGVYDFIAKHRYKWFGKYDACPIPTPETRSLFLP